MAYDCVEKERRKGQGQNLLFEDCRNDPGFEWIIREKDKNVFFDKRSNKWLVRITSQGKCKCYGSFNSPKEAALRYNEVATQLYGEFARLNKIT